MTSKHAPLPWRADVVKGRQGWTVLDARGRLVADFLRKQDALFIAASANWRREADIARGKAERMKKR